ncbi:methyltransferase domain-containing protein [Antrihabitans sp. YC2-6]|uniref:methyltransferase domain-containing protein n=1 Tax=Antrihabitans sp. YC2-6 TaxID=2799498 RepID=UPI0018F4319C|nr:methyltransferase domain-containing protein [Antrihabitans sp. YC2-6]MBJ8346133.1 methyltransferase domain-containing protein [Antrihabitans sp. YC2-6]
MTEPSSPLSFRSDEIDEAALDQLVMVLDLQAALPGIQRLRAWAQAALAAAPGEHALDVGSGTGSEVAAFAAAVGPSGDAVGVDPNPGMRLVAERRAAESGAAARYVEGDAYALPFDDGTFDVVRSERVLQHLVDPERAIAEIVRVVKPGGRVMLIDSDWATSIVHPGDPEVIAAIADVMLSRTANPFSGRKLAGQLRVAGMVVDDIGSQALLQPPEFAAGPLIQMIAGEAITRGAITAEQRDRLVADLSEAGERGTFHSSVTMFAVLAHKPQSAL